MLSTFSWVIVGLAVTIGILGLGFYLLPPSFKVNEFPEFDLGVLEPETVPEPIHHYFQHISSALPQTDTAVIWGRGRIRNGKAWMPLRFKSYIGRGPEMSRYTEVTWYNTPLLRSVDYYIQGEGWLVQGSPNFSMKAPWRRKRSIPPCGRKWWSCHRCI